MDKQTSDSCDGFPSFFDWIEAKDIRLEPYEYELVKALDNNEDRKRQQKIGFHVSRDGKTRLHQLWWEYHTERAAKTNG